MVQRVCGATFSSIESKIRISMLSQNSLEASLFYELCTTKPDFRKMVDSIHYTASTLSLIRKWLPQDFFQKKIVLGKCFKKWFNLWTASHFLAHGKKGWKTLFETVCSAIACNLYVLSIWYAIVNQKRVCVKNLPQVFEWILHVLIVTIVFPNETLHFNRKEKKSHDIDDVTYFFSPIQVEQSCLRIDFFRLFCIKAISNDILCVAQLNALICIVQCSILFISFTQFK